MSLLLGTSTGWARVAGEPHCFTVFFVRTAHSLAVLAGVLVNDMCIHCRLSVPWCLEDHAI